LFLEQFGGGLAPVGGQPSRYNLVEAFVPYVLVLGNQIVQLSRVQRFSKRCPPGRRRAALGGGRHLSSVNIVLRHCRFQRLLVL
jgi:hypothetical protein